MGTQSQLARGTKCITFLAGGPGSGPRAGDSVPLMRTMLKMQGYQRHMGGGSIHETYIHPTTRDEIQVHPDTGAWKRAGYYQDESGNGHLSLAGYLHGTHKMAAEIDAGGPGSGCTGPNCGRPKTAHAVLTGYGWKKKYALTVPHWKTGLGSHTAHMYSHPQHGNMLVNHSGGFKHTDPGGNVQQSGALGKGAAKLEEYLNSVHVVKQEPLVSPFSPKEASLIYTRVSSSKELGGGINVTKLLTLSDGSKAVFKPDEKRVGRNARPGIIENGPDTSTKREAAAWQVAKLVSMDDMVSPCVIRTINGERGALLAYIDGEVAYNAESPYDGKDGLGKAAVFDYVIGNTDRHSGNWIVSGDGNLHLIDHGLAFPQRGYDRPKGDLCRRATFDGISPSSFVAPYLAAQPKILDTLRALNLPQKAIDGVADRIYKISVARDWSNLE